MEAGKPQPPAPYPPQPGQAQPPAYGAPPPQPQPPQQPQPRPNTGYLGAPGGGVPLGGQQQPNANAFGGGDMGRARTRQIPNQNAPQAPAPQAPAGYGPPPQAPANYGQQPPAGYGPPPQQGMPPQGMPPQGPYGQAPMPMGKPTSVMGIISLVMIGVGALTGLASAGFFSFPFFIAGAILGYLAMRETAPWGKKSGRKMAVGGTIANTCCLVLNVVGVIALVMLFQTGVDLAKAQNQSMADGKIIEQRIYDYAAAKGDIQPGGPQMKQGFQNPTAVTGPQLAVADLVTESELQNPIEQYSLVIVGETVSVMWTNSNGMKRQVGHYDPNRPKTPEFNFSDWDDSGFQH